MTTWRPSSVLLLIYENFLKKNVKIIDQPALIVLHKVKVLERPVLNITVRYAEDTEHLFTVYGRISTLLYVRKTADAVHYCTVFIRYNTLLYDIHKIQYTTVRYTADAVHYCTVYHKIQYTIVRYTADTVHYCTVFIRYNTLLCDIHKIQYTSVRYS